MKNYYFVFVEVKKGKFVPKFFFTLEKALKYANRKEAKGYYVEVEVDCETCGT